MRKQKATKSIKSYKIAFDNKNRMLVQEGEREIQI